MRRRTLHRVWTAAAAAAVFLFCAPAMAQPSRPTTRAVPILTGDYVLTDVQLCIPSKGNSSQLSGRVSFDPTTGKAKFNGYSASGNPLTLTHVKQTLSYSNSATTLTLGNTVYHVTYGKLDKGIATYLSSIAIDVTCAAQVLLARQ